MGKWGLVLVLASGCSLLFSPDADDAEGGESCGEAVCPENSFCDRSTGEPLCECDPGFEGVSCAQEINECDPNPCMNAGVCTDLVNGFECACGADWVGLRCESPACPATTISLTSATPMEVDTLTLENVTIVSPTGKLYLASGAMGVKGGKGDSFVDGMGPDESVSFQFDTPVVSIELGSQTIGNGDGNSTVGQVDIEPLDPNGNSLGVWTASDTPLRLESQFGTMPMASFLLTAHTLDWRSLRSLTFTIPCQ